MMRVYLSIILVFLSLLLSCDKLKKQEKVNKIDIKSIKVHQVSVPCRNEKNLECLAKNYPELYNKDFELFFEILEVYALSINSKCDSTLGEKYLKFVAKESFDGEIGEFVCDTIEQAFVENPKCIIGILSKINDDYITKRIVFYIQSTLFLTPEKSKQLIKKLKQNPQYRFLFKE